MKNKALFKRVKKIDFSKYYPLIFTIFFVFILSNYAFPTFEAISYDLRLRYDFGINFKDNIVLITIDEESDEFLGETYPYTYASHSKLLQKLNEDRPKIINYLVSLDSPESIAEQELLIQFKQKVHSFTNEGGIFRFGTEIDEQGELLPPVELRELGYSTAFINIDGDSFAEDSISRKSVLNISGYDSLHLWTANEMRKLQGLAPLEASTFFGAFYYTEADATMVRHRYYTSPTTAGKIQRVPFHRVMVGNFPKGFFRNKVVLVGPSYITSRDNFVLTPFDTEKVKTPKLNLHAVIIQSFSEGKTVYPISRNITYGLSLILAIILSLTISEVSPGRGLAITFSLMIFIIILAFLLFSLFGIWLYLTHLVLVIFVVYYIWVPFRAIGEYQRRFAIQEETKLLKKVESLKQNFISLMSHDLKTPVAKIAGMADVLIQQYGNDQLIKRNLNAILDSTKELNKFITSILDLTKIESQNLNLNTTSKDINIVISDIVQSLGYEARAKEIKVEELLDPLYPISFDVDLMKRVLSNLIENAIKYSGEKTTVEVKSWDDEKWVYIQVKDNGVGIPQDDLEYIFEKFYRVKNDANHSIKGTGLGLYLVKYFVELHGGKIKAKSVVGQGTAFLVRLKNA